MRVVAWKGKGRRVTTTATATGMDRDSGLDSLVTRLERAGKRSCWVAPRPENELLGMVFLNGWV